MNSTSAQDIKQNITHFITVSGVIILFGAIILFAFGSQKERATGRTVPAITFDSTMSVIIHDTLRIDSIKKTIIYNETKTVRVDTGFVAKSAMCTECIKDRLNISLPFFGLLFGVMLLLILLQRLKNFKISKDGVEGELFELAKVFNEAQNQNAQNPRIPQGGKTATAENMENFYEEKARLAEQFGGLDPQKGKWGGSSISNSRKLTANIAKIIGSEWADIILRVESTSIETMPLTGFVVFHLHPTFNNPSPIIIVINGIAELKIKAWGAFTVGAVADNGGTLLELDLREHPASFEPFKSR